MENKRHTPVPGEFYRHFKNRLYQIVAIARDSESGEAMVVYQALYGEFQVWVRPLSMFMEETDREKYPDAAQTYRFEQVLMPGAAQEERTSGLYRHGEGATENVCREEAETAEERPLNPYLLEFFDAMDGKQYDKMLEALAKLSRDATPKEIDDIAMVLDFRPMGESCEEQIADIRRHVRMLKKFDGERLR